MDVEDRARYSADLPTSGAAAPPGNAEVVRVRDVLLIPGSGVEQGDTADLALLPHSDPEEGEWTKPGPIDLDRRLTLAKLEHDEGNRVLNACSQRGHYFVPVKQFGQMYSLVREVELDEIELVRWTWDTDGVISDALAMSRLILDNGYSTQYAARIFDYANQEQQVMPAPMPQPGAWRVRQSRDWLTTAEAEELRDLLSGFWSVRDSLPDRVSHALWLAEYVVSVRWLDVIAPLLVVAFEALVNTSKQLVTRQFEERVPEVTEEAGARLSKTLCSKMYDVRSRWVHGRRVSLYQPPKQKGEPGEGPTDAEQKVAVERVAKTQDSLRAVVRRCIEDREFRAIFAADETIRSRWPVTV
jgi:hypothetical protein